MQRATRSASQQPQATAETPVNPAKLANARGRKRKQPQSSSDGVRSSSPIAEEDTKHTDPVIPSTDPLDNKDADIKATIELDENEVPVYMSSEEAHMMLEVLQKIDTDGLLDQPVNVAAVVFSHSIDDQHEVSSTLRSLLDQSTDVSLRHLQKAAQDFIQRVAPRSRRRSAVSDRTRKFCDLLHQLLSELITTKGAIAADRLDLQPAEEPKQRPIKPTHYALYQQLPTGTYFTSAVQLTKGQLSALRLAQAEPVAVVPSQQIPVASLPKLSTLAAATSAKRRAMDTVPAVTWLPYDAFSSFAPSYASNGTEPEPYDTLLAYEASKAFKRWEKEAWPSTVPPKPRERKESHRPRRTKSGKERHDHAGGESKSAKRHREDDDEEHHERSKRRKPDASPVQELAPTPAAEVLDAAPGGQLTDLDWSVLRAFGWSEENPADLGVGPDDKLPAVDKALFDVELLAAVDGLLEVDEKAQRIDPALEENAEALKELMVLQEARMRKDDPIKEDAPELLLATAVERNIATLIDYQPRLADQPDSTPLIPPPALLRHAQSNLPAQPVPGYKGILNPSHHAALKDNTTVRAGLPPTYELPPVPAPPLYTPANPYTPAPPQRYQAPRHPGYGAGAYTTPIQQYIAPAPYPPGQTYPTAYSPAAYGQYSSSPYNPALQAYATNGAYPYAGTPTLDRSVSYQAYPHYLTPQGTYGAASALPHHMRPAIRPSPYPTPTGQAYGSWSK